MTGPATRTPMLRRLRALWCVRHGHRYHEVGRVYSGPEGKAREVVIEACGVCGARRDLMHTTNQPNLVGHGCQLRQEFSEANSRQAGLNGLVGATNPFGSVGLWIESIQMGQTAVDLDPDEILDPVGASGRVPIAGSERTCQTEADRPGGAGVQCLAPRHVAVGCHYTVTHFCHGLQTSPGATMSHRTHAFFGRSYSRIP